MWKKTHSVLTKAVTKEQIWQLFADVNNWHIWDDDIEYAHLQGKFEKGNFILLKPKGGPKVKIELVEMHPNEGFLDVTKFPLAKMYDYHSFEQTPDGLKITNTITVKGILAFVWIKLVAQNMVHGLPVHMEKQIQAAGKY